MSVEQPDVPALRVAGLTKAFGGQPVLEHVDLDVGAATIAVVLGPSGGGKTTLLRLIAGFDRPDEGIIDIAGRRVSGGDGFIRPERRQVGIVPQEGALFPHLDVAGNVGFGLPRSMDRSARRERLEETLALVGLAGFERRRPRQLSGGQQHRVALARALAADPSLVLLDEPFSSLDTALRAQVRTEVLHALRAAGATAVLVTHDQVEALAIADQLAVLLDGRIVQAGPPHELYERPATADVAAFLGDSMLLPATVGHGTAHTALGACPTAAALTGEATVVIRPEQLSVVDVADAADGLAGTVVETAYYGHDAMVHVRLAGDMVVRVRTSPQPRLAPGAAVGVSIAGPVWAVPRSSAQTAT